MCSNEGEYAVEERGGHGAGRCARIRAKAWKRPTLQILLVAATLLAGCGVGYGVTYAFWSRDSASKSSALQSAEATPADPPTDAPTYLPSYVPTSASTDPPVDPPTGAPTFVPSSLPTPAPTAPTGAPTFLPSYMPKTIPTKGPSNLRGFEDSDNAVSGALVGDDEGSADARDPSKVEAIDPPKPVLDVYGGDEQVAKQSDPTLWNLLSELGNSALEFFGSLIGPNGYLQRQRNGP
ncbi:hypothetical protein ACHAWF_001732 [Thalassiosira exigua]